MADKDDKKAVLIIRRLSKAPVKTEASSTWKIAYADFVTAMMAFFLLMWLLGSTTQGDLKGIAEYFQNPLKVTMFGGPSSGNSSSPIPGGGSNIEESFGQEQKGSDDRKQIRKAAQKALADAQRQQEYKRLQNLQADLTSLISEDPRFSSIKSQIKLGLIDDGLEIQLIDRDGKPMFAPGSSKPQEYLIEALKVISKMLNEVPNRISINGHTDSTAYSAGDAAYSNWELSAERANSARQVMVKNGIEKGKVIRVAGMADMIPYSSDPKDPSNRRISIVVLNKEAEDEILRKNESGEKPDDAMSQDPSSSKMDFSGVAPRDIAAEKSKNAQRSGVQIEESVSPPAALQNQVPSTTDGDTGSFSRPWLQKN